MVLKSSRLEGIYQATEWVQLGWLRASFFILFPPQCASTSDLWKTGQFSLCSSNPWLPESASKGNKLLTMAVQFGQTLRNKTKFIHNDWLIDIRWYRISVTTDLRQIQTWSRIEKLHIHPLSHWIFFYILLSEHLETPWRDGSFPHLSPAQSLLDKQCVFNKCRMRTILYVYNTKNIYNFLQPNKTVWLTTF